MDETDKPLSQKYLRLCGKYLIFCILFLFINSCGEHTEISSEGSSVIFSIRLAGHSKSTSSALQKAINCTTDGIATIEAHVYDPSGTLLASGGHHHRPDHRPDFRFN